mmetsp:Transcript_15914/g.21045  ORF Transcript_15914/g.21045 Transcript_15914/m.21045 type:complete len:83 (-) Transcript_15914:7-255(-)
MLLFELFDITFRIPFHQVLQLRQAHYQFNFFARHDSLLSNYVFIRENLLNEEQRNDVFDFHSKHKQTTFLIFFAQKQKEIES